MFSVRFTQTADACFSALAPRQRSSILRIIGLIQTDPAPDNRVKFVLHELGDFYTIYLDHQQHWVVYTVEGNEISVVGVGVGGPYVSTD